MVIVLIVEQPFASVTVQEYNPATILFTVAVVPTDGDHE